MSPLLVALSRARKSKLSRNKILLERLLGQKQRLLRDGIGSGRSLAQYLQYLLLIFLIFLAPFSHRFNQGHKHFHKFFLAVHVSNAAGAVFFLHFTNPLLIGIESLMKYP